MRSPTASLLVSSILVLFAVVSTTTALSHRIQPNLEQRFQPMLGVGGALTESSVKALSALPKEQRLKVLRRFFSSSNSSSSAPPPSSARSKHTKKRSDVVGGNFGVIRLPITASDFSLSYWTCDDTHGNQGGSPPDYSLKHFSVAQFVADGTIALLREILDIRPDLYIITTPWTPPAWLKKPSGGNSSSSSLCGGNFSSSNSSGNYRVYARLFRKIIEAFYSSFHIRVAALTLQNEPLFSTDGYPSMFLSAEEETELAAHVITEFASSSTIRDKTFTKIMLYDHNWNVPEYPVDVLSGLLSSSSSLRDNNSNKTKLNNSNSKKLVDEFVLGAAFHCYAGDPSGQLVFQKAFPDFGIFMTECSGGSWAPDFGPDLMWDTKTLTMGSVENFGRAVVKWNLALNQNHGPKLSGGCNNCRGVVTVDADDDDDDVVSWNEDFVALAHLGAVMPVPVAVAPPRSVNSGSRRSAAAGGFVFRVASDVASTSGGNISAVSFFNVETNMVSVLVRNSGATLPKLEVVMKLAGAGFSPATTTTTTTTATNTTELLCVAVLENIPYGVATLMFHQQQLNQKTQHQQCSTSEVEWFVTNATDGSSEVLAWRDPVPFS